MPFTKGTITRGFRGKKHSEYSKWLMSEGHKRDHAKRRSLKGGEK